MGDQLLVSQIEVEREEYSVKEGLVVIISLSYNDERIERYFLISMPDFGDIEINQLSAKMAFRLVRRKH